MANLFSRKTSSGEVVCTWVAGSGISQGHNIPVYQIPPTIGTQAWRLGRGYSASYYFLFEGVAVSFVLSARMSDVNGRTHTSFMRHVNRQRHTRPWVQVESFQRSEYSRHREAIQ